MEMPRILPRDSGGQAKAQRKEAREQGIGEQRGREETLQSAPVASALPGTSSPGGVCSLALFRRAPFSLGKKRTTL
ncbi:hypothetical protein TGRH88_050790 [Toxoplasma gondii]|uniref:Uncharacterized protein n=1 Tax=Toxoplasma gondii TaxID=5811 RepID=A0A7J6JWT6_TOXGO|nr:hypothetical protein TGRH88_050790 [Toxoplasma gondii]